MSRENPPQVGPNSKPLMRSIIWLCVAALAGWAVAVVGVYLLLSSLPCPTDTNGVADCAGRNTAADTSSVTFALVGGVGTVAYLVMSYRRRDHEEVIEQQSEARAREEERDRGVKLLSGSSVPKQIAGVHTLFDLAEREHEMRQPIVNILCGHLAALHGENPSVIRQTINLFVQKWEPLPDPDRGLADVGESSTRNASEDSGADTAVRDQPLGKEDSWRRLDYDFSGCVFPEGLRLSRLRLSGTIRFTEAEFAKECRLGDMAFDRSVDFSGAVFSDGVALSHCTFEGGVDFSRARGEGMSTFQWNCLPEGLTPDFAAAKGFAGANAREDEQFGTALRRAGLGGAADDGGQADSDATEDGSQELEAKAILTQVFEQSADDKGTTIGGASDVLRIPYAAANKLRLLRVLSELDSPGRRPEISLRRVRMLEPMRDRATPEGVPALSLMMGVEDGPLPPSPYFEPDSADPWMAKRFEAVLNSDLGMYAEKLKSGEYKVSGFWTNIGDDKLAALVKQNGVVLASYAGFTLQGGHAVAFARIDWEGRSRFAVVVEPFRGDEEETYVGTYRRPGPGGAAQLWPSPDVGS